MEESKRMVENRQSPPSFSRNVYLNYHFLFNRDVEDPLGAYWTHCGLFRAYWISFKGPFGCVSSVLSWPSFICDSLIFWTYFTYKTQLLWAILTLIELHWKMGYYSNVLTATFEVLFMRTITIYVDIFLPSLALTYDNQPIIVYFLKWQRICYLKGCLQTVCHLMGKALKKTNSLPTPLKVTDICHWEELYNDRSTNRKTVCHPPDELFVWGLCWYVNYLGQRYWF